MFVLIFREVSVLLIQFISKFLCNSLHIIWRLWDVASLPIGPVNLFVRLKTLFKLIDKLSICTYWSVSEVRVWPKKKRCSNEASSLSILSHDFEGYFADVDPEHGAQTLVWLLFKLASGLIEPLHSAAKVCKILEDCFGLFLYRFFFILLRSYRFFTAS